MRNYQRIPSRCHPPLCKDLRQHFTVAALMARDEGQGAFHGGLDRSVGDVKGAHQSPSQWTQTADGIKGYNIYIYIYIIFFYFIYFILFYSILYYIILYYIILYAYIYIYTTIYIYIYKGSENMFFRKSVCEEKITDQFPTLP